jgi:hypothetical protein
MIAEVTHRLNKYDRQVNCDLQMLEYTLDGAASAPAASSSTLLSWDHAQQKLEQFLKQGQPSFDQICDWINVSIITSF